MHASQPESSSVAGTRCAAAVAEQLAPGAARAREHELVDAAREQRVRDLGLLGSDREQARRQAAAASSAAKRSSTAALPGAGFTMTALPAVNACSACTPASIKP